MRCSSLRASRPSSSTASRSAPRSSTGRSTPSASARSRQCTERLGVRAREPRRPTGRQPRRHSVPRCARDLRPFLERGPRGCEIRFAGGGLEAGADEQVAFATRTPSVESAAAVRRRAVRSRPRLRRRAPRVRACGPPRAPCPISSTRASSASTSFASGKSAVCTALAVQRSSSCRRVASASACARAACSIARRAFAAISRASSSAASAFPNWAGRLRFGTWSTAWRHTGHGSPATRWVASACAACASRARSSATSASRRWVSARSATAATCSVAAVASTSAVRAASIASASVEAVACASRARSSSTRFGQRVDRRVELGQRGLRRGGCLAHRPCLRRGRFGRRGELRDLAWNGDRVELGHDLGGAAGACVGLRDRRDELLVARARSVEVVMQLEQGGAPLLPPRPGRPRLRRGGPPAAARGSRSPAWPRPRAAGRAGRCGRRPRDRATG